ncbi:MAG: ABC transporter permease/substrate-binding protein [Acidobacteria bacterium]|nr:ABC transporter permease/substrate-binding protein [Acidobacteriota bacterium]
MSALLAFLASHQQELVTRLGEHVVLVVAATVLAAAIGIPLGIVAAKRPALGRPLVGLANLAQTIPSLALFGFLIPLPIVGGIGARAALVALTLYAVLPIVRTTLAGIQGVDRTVLECAVAMGMTRRQVLRQIELPLALPAMAAGVRVATVTGVGTATIASAVGAGGLGDYIFRGLAMVDATVILAGAIPAALLALAADGGLAAVTRALDPRHGSRRARRATAASAAVLVVGLGVLIVGSNADVGPRIVVGSKNFTEQVLLGEIVAQAIEQAGLAVDRRLNLGGTLVCDAALKRGDIDVYVEYTGTALTAIFDQPVAGNREAVFTHVRERYAAVGVSLMPRLGFNNTFAVLVRQEAAAEHGLERISDLARVASGWRAGFGYEFLERPDGFPGLARTYHLTFSAPPRVMDLNLIYRALDTGEIDVTAGDTTSGLIEALQLTVLADDRQYFPPYDAAPVARADSLLANPAMRAALDRLAGRISEQDMRRMNHAVDGLKQDHRIVARAFVDSLNGR